MALREREREKGERREKKKEKEESANGNKVAKSNRTVSYCKVLFWLACLYLFRLRWRTVHCYTDDAAAAAVDAVWCLLGCSIMTGKWASRRWTRQKAAGTLVKERGRAKSITISKHQSINRFIHAQSDGAQLEQSCITLSLHQALQCTSLLFLCLCFSLSFSL